MTAANGAMHEISAAIGELRAELRGVRDVMVEHHSSADREWEKLTIELRSIKLDQREMERKVESLCSHRENAGRIEGKFETRIERIETRLTALDRVVDRAMTKAAAILAIVSVIATGISFIIAHYSGVIIRAVFGKDGS